MMFLTRLSRLMRADMHALLDRLEDPAVLLRQAEREMNEAIDSHRRDLRALAQEATRLQTRREQLEKRQALVNTEIDNNFDRASETALRGLLRRRLELEAMIASLDEHIDELHAEHNRRTSELAQKEARLEAIRQQGELLNARRVDYVEPDEDSLRFTVSDDDVDLALQRERERRARQ